MGQVLQTLCLAPAPFLALLVLAIAAPRAWAEQPGVVKIADGPAFSIFRGDKLFEAAKGVKLLAGDFIETQPGSFLVADLPSGTVAFGPSTRLYLLGADGLTFVVLRGWLKLDAHPTTGEGALHRAIAMQFGAAARQAVFVLHASDRRDEVFQESGVMTLLVREDVVTRSNRESKITRYFAREDRNLSMEPRRCRCSRGSNTRTGVTSCTATSNRRTLLITRDGMVKITDFGIAKPAQSKADRPPDRHSAVHGSLSERRRADRRGRNGLSCQGSRV